ncbi:H-NS histone family protein [Burkholderia ubonensis]|uniref:H-NS histone family protein n=1 Tax=Burkholderia ubonensis TaxID=101571 RepID=UPI0009B3C2D4|nr:H-NS histone family protein [Burkholderia ubonensis]
MMDANIVATMDQFEVARDAAGAGFAKAQNQLVIEERKTEQTRPVAAALTMDQIEAENEAARIRFEETQARLKEAIARNRESEIRRLQADIYRYGVTKSELKFSAPQSVPKYRDPVSGNTWSGKGNAPSWANGKHLEHFLNPEWWRSRTQNRRNERVDGRC